MPKDASGQVKQPRWARCWEMWQELAQSGSQGTARTFGLSAPSCESVYRLSFH
jgi:hypothetical protein